MEEWQCTTDNFSVPRKFFSNRGITIADYKSEQKTENKIKNLAKIN